MVLFEQIPSDAPLGEKPVSKFTIIKPCGAKPRKKKKGKEISCRHYVE